MSTALARGQAQAVVRANDSPALARADLAAARARVARQLAALEQSLPPLTDWREVVRRHPMLTLGGAFFAGWALARFFSRR